VQQQHQHVAHQKSSSDHHVSSRQVGGVNAGGAWSAERDVSDSDDDDGAEICVVDDDETTNHDNNDDVDDDDDDSGRRGIASPQRTAAVAAGYHVKPAYNQQLSPPRSSADIYPSHKSQGLHYCHRSHRYYGIMSLYTVSQKMSQVRLAVT